MVESRFVDDTGEFSRPPQNVLLEITDRSVVVRIPTDTTDMLVTIRAGEKFAEYPYERLRSLGSGFHTLNGDAHHGTDN